MDLEMIWLVVALDLQGNDITSKLRLQGHKNLASVIGAAVHRQTGVSLSELNVGYLGYLGYLLAHLWGCMQAASSPKRRGGPSSKQCELLNIGCPKMTIPTVPQWWFHGLPGIYGSPKLEAWIPG